MAACVCVPGASIANAGIVSWNASSGLTPDQIGYTLNDTSAPEDPVLAGGVLSLISDDPLESMWYVMTEPDLDLQPVVEINFRMRYVSGTNTVNFRTPAGIFVTTAPGIGSILQIGDDEVFFLSGHTTRGPANTSIDTNAFHDYRMVINGTASGSGVDLYQDSLLVLSGASYTTAVSHGTVGRIGFGDGTSNEAGSTEWTSFSHNASAVPEPSALAALLLVVCGLSCRRRNRQSGQ